jgi:RNA-directed DNA polymerase
MLPRTGTSSFGNVDDRIRRRLRALLVRQKKRQRHLYRHLLRHLLRLGISRGMAWKSAYGIRGHWKRSASFGLHKAYSNAWFAERLVSLRVRWQDFHPTGYETTVVVLGCST